MKKIQDILADIKKNDIKFADLRFTDTTGKLHHMSMDISQVDEDMFEKGILFDGSSIAGWKAINESDMALVPDLNKTYMDPFFAHPTMVFMCDVVDPVSKKPYNRDPRSIAKRAQAYVEEIGIADTAYIGPEAEFFIFDDVRYKIDPYHTSFSLDAEELPSNDNAEYSTGNLGHRPRPKGGYVPVPPIDSCQDIRAEMLLALKTMGLSVEKHHHEVAAAQHELGIKYDTLVSQADNMQTYKYAVHQTAQNYGKTATFMPKPVMGDNGSGMHVHISLWKNNKPLFAGEGYAGLSETCLHFIGGIIKHAKALNAFTNPSTNSYKRLTPGFEAPVLLAYSARNRSAACRIPFSSSPYAKRVEVRFPDPTANPYLAFSALLMAGIDGIKNKIHPGQAMDKDLYELPQKEIQKIPSVCRSLREALEALEQDHAFLTTHNVFDEDQIQAYIALKMEEVYRLEKTPHPIEFDMYYSS